MGLFISKSIQIKHNEKFSFSVTPATSQMLSSHLWRVAAILDGPGSSFRTPWDSSLCSAFLWQNFECQVFPGEITNHPGASFKAWIISSVSQTMSWPLLCPLMLSEVSLLCVALGPHPGSSWDPEELLTASPPFTAVASPTLFLGRYSLSWILKVIVGTLHSVPAASLNFSHLVWHKRWIAVLAYCT